MNVSSIVEWFKGNLTLAIVLSAVTVFGSMFALLQWKDHELAVQREALSDSLAMHDRLHEILKTEYGTLSGRFAFLENDVNAKASENAVLKKYLAQSHAKVEELSIINTKTAIENQTLRGRLAKDSVGEFATFDSSAQWWSMSLAVRLHPSPILEIRALSINDATTIAFVDEGPLIRGVINHANPYVVDIGGEFFRKNQTPQLDTGFNWLPYVEGGVAGILIGWTLKTILTPKK